MALAAILNLWALSRNGWANDYYAAAVRSMSTSWHDFLYGSLDSSGVMTVDKPPLALWVQALSVRVFGFSSLSILVPQALMGVASVALLYDLVRRFFGRLGGFAAGLALALTPMFVAVSRHNNPDALLVLCSLGALWCAVRGLVDGRLRWLVLSGVCVGLGFETKMGVALVVVPGIALAWLWIAPAARGRLHALRQLLTGGAAMVAVGGAWPLLVELTPAADRPWISGTSDNRVLSLIFEYNGLGRVDGQTGGPGGGAGMGGNMFGGSTGPARLLNAALGGQAGWLLGFAVVGGLAILLATRLRSSEKRSGWLIAVGGAFLVTAVLFSFASGIFHPYYVSLLAPFVAALFGAGIAQLLQWPRGARLLGPAAILAGVVVELVVRSRYPGQLAWLAPVLIVCGLAAGAALLVARSRRARLAALAAIGAALLLAPGVWAFDTLGYATSSTFPAGGPASAEQGGGGFGGPGGGRGGVPGASGAGGRGGTVGGQPLFGPAGSGAGAGAAQGTPSGGGPELGASGTAPAGIPGVDASAGGSGTGRAFGPGAGGAGGGGFGGAGSIDEVLSYVKRHGGGTIAVASQSSAAAAILQRGASVAGIGGFSGRESDVSVSWLAQEVRSGKIRWVLDEEESPSGLGGGGGGGLPGDSRKGSRAAISAAASVCQATEATSSSGGGSGKLYDCQGRASALARAAAQESST
ncbi:MAG TPA: glycosyltransferase family 39 protein [Solirubrobacteraceae bacterium]|jgi:4-amino-4-deoxy-L-arabinose transferase-like glycosyltransferase